ncbi:hypothetical protein JCM10449v2_004198 [Rhodotorula kratochvilovae]
MSNRTSMAPSSAASTPYQRGPGTPILGLPAVAGGVSSPRPSGQVSSAADLTASVRRTTGDRPPPLVGCSVTLIGDAVFVFGGRLVPTRTMVGTLYRLDLASGAWAQLWPPAAGEDEGANGAQGPQARYFHSACAWGDKLVIFGGEGYGADESASGSSFASTDATPETDPALALRTLDDVFVWDTAAGRWLDGETSCAEGVERPAARYAHLGVVTSAAVADGEGEKREKAVMLVMGGQDIKNTYLHSVNILDLETMTWVKNGNWERHIGTYRAVAASPRYSVVPTTSTPSPLADDASSLEPLIQLAHSTPIDQSDPEHVVLYSNFNFSQVRRDLDLLESALSTSSPLAPTALSTCMTGAALPPGLRFPTGTIIGRHLLVFGTFLSSAANNFSIWALDLGPAGAKGVRERVARGEKLEWMRIDPGSVLARGSWNRAVGWGNTVVVLGDRERDIAADYDHRQTNFAHLAVVDLESFGIYQPPPLPLPLEAQALGLYTLSQPYLADFEIVCSDGKRLGCSRQVLVERWPWFKAKLDDFRQRASSVQSAQQKREADSAAAAAASDAAESSDEVNGGESSSTRTTDEQRLTPRTLDLPEPSAVVQAFLQYLHTLTLCTPLQLHPPVLSALVVFAKTYDDDALRAWCVHALHGVLEGEAAAAPLVYEAATVAGCTALQIRALRTMLSNPALRARPSPRPPSVAQGSSVDFDAGSTSSSSRTRGGGGASGASSASWGASRAPPPASLRGFQHAAGSSSPGRSPRSPRSPRSFGPPSSPPPTSPLPLLPPSPLPSAASAEPWYDARRRPSKPPSDCVAEPTPDEVAPIPVPLFSPFLSPDPPLSPPPRSPRRSTGSSRSSEAGYFDAIPQLLSDAEDDSFGESLLGSSPSRLSVGTSATSVRSRSSSVGKASLGSTAPHGPAPWTTRLETQVEEDEPASPGMERKVGAVAVAEASLAGDEPTPHAATSPSQSSAMAMAHLRPPRFSISTSLLSKHRKRRPSGGVDETGDGADDAEHWTPSFFDTVKGGSGSVRNPLSTRKATAISPELLENLDLEPLAAPQPLVSPPLLASELVEGEGEELFVHPRPAPAPSLLAVSSSLAPNVSTTSLIHPPANPANPAETRRHSLDPRTLRLFSPPASRSPRGASPLARSPSCSASLSPSDRSSVSSSTSVGMDRMRSSSGESAYSLDELVTPPLPSVAVLSADANVLVYDPLASETVPLGSPASSSLGLSGLAGPPRAKSPVPASRVDEFGRVEPVPFTHGATASLAASSRVHLPAPSLRAATTPSRASAFSRSSLSLAGSNKSSSSKPLSAKEQRHALEVQLGTRVLEAAGASATEIRLRARSVGFQVLKQREDDAKKRGGGKAGALQGLGLTGALGEFVGGAELSSKFSID